MKRLQDNVVVDFLVTWLIIMPLVGLFHCFIWADKWKVKYLHWYYTKRNIRHIVQQDKFGPHIIKY